MKITLTQVEKSRQLLTKLAKHQETVAKWEAAVRGYRAAEGHRVVEVQFTTEGQVRYLTEKHEEAGVALLKKSG
jgi:hypothetical protein